MALIILSAATLIVDALGSGLYRRDFSSRLIDWLGCTPQGVANGWLWQLLTYPWLSPNLLTMVFAAYFFYQFAGMLEMRLGSGRFFWLYLWGSSGSALAAIGIMRLLRYFLPGLSPADIPATYSFAPILAILVVLGLYYPNQDVLLFFLIPAKMKFLALFGVTAAALATLTSLRWGKGFPHLVELCGALMGYLWFKYLYRVRFHFLRKYLGYLRFKRNKLKIIDGNRDDYVKNSDKYIN